MNKRVLLASRPVAAVTESNFRVDEAPVPKPAEGEVLVRNLWLSLDPYMRGRMSDAKSYVKGVDIGEVMVGQTVGEVVESRHAALKVGDTVLTQLGWQLYGATREATRIELDAVVDHADGPDTQADGAQSDDRLQRALMARDGDQRALVVLKHVQDFSYEPIAAILECPVKAG